MNYKLFYVKEEIKFSLNRLVVFKFYIVSTRFFIFSKVFHDRVFIYYPPSFYFKEMEKNPSRVTLDE